MILVLAGILAAWFAAAQLSGVLAVVVGVCAIGGSLWLLRIDYRYVIPIAFIHWILAFTSTGWPQILWAVFAVAGTVFVVSHIRYLYGAPWRRMFFPLWRWYNRQATVAAALTVHGQSQVDLAEMPQVLLPRMLCELNPDLSESEATTCVKGFSIAFESMFDDPWTRAVFADAVGRQTTDEECSDAAARMMREYNAYFVRYVIGMVIGSKLGDKQKRLYWTAVFRGQLP